jgi:hypothetical protein
MILHVAYSGVGGTGSFVCDLCPGLGKHHGENAQVIFYGFLPLHSEYGQRLANAGIPYYVVGKRPGLDVYSIYALSRAIRRINPDVVVMHGGGERAACVGLSLDERV